MKNSKKSRRMLKCISIGALAAATATSCQGKNAVNSDTAPLVEETNSSTQSVPILKCGTMATKPAITATETYSEETVSSGTITHPEYVASLTEIVENGEVVGTYPDGETTPSQSVANAAEATPFRQSNKNNPTTETVDSVPSPSAYDGNKVAQLANNVNSTTSTPQLNVDEPVVTTTSSLANIATTQANTDEPSVSDSESTQIDSVESATFNVALSQINPVKVASPEEEEKEAEIVADEVTMYTIQPGDTLSQIAESFGVSLEDLLRINEITSPDDYIYSGDVLKIPKKYNLNLEALEIESTCQELSYENTCVLDEVITNDLPDEFSTSNNNIEDYSSVDDVDENVTVDNDSDYLHILPDEEFNEIMKEIDRLSRRSNNAGSDNVVEEAVVNNDILAEDSVTESSSQIDITEDSAVSSDGIAEEKDFDSFELEENTDYSYTAQVTPVSDQKTQDLLASIHNLEAEFPGTTIGMGIYSLDGTPLFEYNQFTPISGACTIKAPYAAYVLQCCEKEGINISNLYLMYEESMQNSGSGMIQYDPVRSVYNVEYLIEQMLSISDNTAYNILVERFPLDGYQEFLNTIGGQQLDGLQYGAASVTNRKNEWIAIYNYFNSDHKYSGFLRNAMTNTPYCYLTDCMVNAHQYQHKSGWCDGISYTSASDCAIIDNQYLVVVLTQDYVTGVAHTKIVETLGIEAELFMS